MQNEAIEDCMEEQQPVQMVSTDSCTFPFTSISSELEDVCGRLREIPGKHLEVVKREIEKVCEELGKLAKSCNTSRVVHQKICEFLDMRGIESEEDWDQYVDTIEKDGGGCRKELKARSETLKGPNEDQEKDRLGEHRDITRDVTSSQMRDKSVLQAASMPWTGAPCEHKWKQCAGTCSAEPREIPGFGENIRVVISDQTLVEILGDDHLGGKAKSVFLYLPVEVKKGGSEMVVHELEKLLAEDSVAGRMRAIAEFRELKIRPHQDVADFCVALEKLGRKANPQATTEDSSLEFAHILLSNLKDWPEHVQFLSALHRTKPEKAYEEVKQLALSIELSRRMYTGRQEEKRGAFREWKARATSYNSNHAQWSRGRPTMEREPTERGKEGVAEAERKTYPEASFTGRASERRLSPTGRRALEKNNDSKKCFKCSRFGHIAKECTQRTHVNRINETQVKRESPEHCNVGKRTAEGVVCLTKGGLGCGTFKVRNLKLEVPHERIQEYNRRVRKQVKVKDHRKQKLNMEKHAKVGDRVYLRAPKEKTASSHPKLTPEWTGPFRVLETSQNSALTSRIGENEDPIRVQFDMSRVVPNCISDEPINTRTARGKRGRKPAKASVCCTEVPFFSDAAIMSSLEKGQMQFSCERIKSTTLKETRNTNSPRAVAEEPIDTPCSASDDIAEYRRRKPSFATSSRKLWTDDYSLKRERPEAKGQFLTNHVGAGVPKQAYEAARKKAVGAMLPVLPDARCLTSRAMSTPGEGVWVKRGVPVKRRCGRETPC